MTSFQRFMIAWLARRGGRAVIAGQLVNKSDVRCSADLAELLYWEVM